MERPQAKPRTYDLEVRRATAILGDEEGQVAVHQAAAARFRAEAAAHAAAAAREHEEAERARQERLRALGWGSTARDAHTFGERLISQEDKVAVPVGEALTRAGGTTEVYAGKRVLSMGGA